MLISQFLEGIIFNYGQSLYGRAGQDNNNDCKVKLFSHLNQWENDHCSVTFETVKTSKVLIVRCKSIGKCKKKKQN